MKKIKNLTYNNLLYVSKKIQEKGYNEKESILIAKNIFNEFENRLNPYLQIDFFINKILDKAEYEKQYKNFLEV